MTMIYGVGLFCLVILSLHLLSISIAAVQARPRRSPLAPPRPAPGVSVVRPVCGIDNFCEETLESSFGLDYPEYEVIFCVAEATDPVVPVVRRLIARHPERPAQLIIGDEKISANPKLNNCVRGWDAARYDWIILGDANVLMPKDYIQRLLASWRPRTGLVCSMPLGSRPTNLWAELECAFLNTFEARWQYCAEFLGLGFAQGKSMLARRDIIEAGGGIRALASDIIEDAAATKLVREQGLCVNLVDSPFEQPLGHRVFRDVWLRQLRWARTRRKTFALYYAPEIFASSVLPGAAAAFVAAALDWSIAATLLAFGVVWYAPEVLLARANHWYDSWRMPYLCLLRDLMMPIIYIDAWCMNDFVWRGNAMTMRADEDQSPSRTEGFAGGFRLARHRLSESFETGRSDFIERWRKGLNFGFAVTRPRSRRHHDRD
jgi:ceramide glucosyltransferase